MLDQDPDKMNADPQPWLKELVADTLVAHLVPIRAEMDRILQDTAYLGNENMAISSILTCTCWLTRSGPSTVGPLSECLWESVVHTLDLDTVSSISRVFHHVSSEMSIAIFETFHCFLRELFVLFKHKGFVPVFNNSVRKEVSFHFQSGWLDTQI